MSDAVKELVIRIKRDDAQALASQRAYHAAEKKGLQQSLTDAEVAERARTELIKREIRQRVQEAAKATKTTVEQANAAEKAKADAAKATDKAIADGMKLVAQIEKQTAKERAAANKAFSKEVATEVKALETSVAQAEKNKVATSKQAARDTLAAVKKQIEESERLERELFAEGKQLAAQQATREKKDEQNAIASSRLVFGEKKKGFDAQTKATDEAAAATRQMTRTLLGTQVAGAALNAVKMGIDAIAQSSAEARARIQALNAEAAAARFGDREVAALTGNRATVAFSASQAGEAAQAGVSPEAYRGAQLAFQAQAGQYIGEGAQSKLSGDEAKDLMQRVVSFSASQGIDAADPARLMGAIISKGKKGESNASRLTTFAKAFKALQLAPGETSPLVGQLTELIQEEVGQGASFNNVLEAVPLIRSMAERNPGEASTYGRALIRGFREISLDPKKAAELGIDGKMGFMDKVRAVSDKAAAVTAAGGDEGEFLSKYFKDIRSFGAARVALSGVRGKSPEMIQAEMAGVNEGTVNASILDYRNGEEGQAQAAASREKQAKLEQAASPGMLMLQAARARASTSLESAGGLNQGEGFFGSIFTAAGQAAGYGDRKQQEETALVGTELAQRLSGYPGGREWMRRNSMTPGVTPFSLGSRAAPESSMVEGFKLLSDLRDAARALKDAGDAIKQTKPPVPPPAPAKPPAIGRP